MNTGGWKKDAIIIGPYRYLLTRSWGPGPKVCFVMLNPSTADASVDDATIRKCIAFARRWGFDGIEVVNVYAFRATDPVDLFKADDPVGPLNDGYIMDVTKRCAKIVVAWGAHAREPRVEQVKYLFKCCKVKAEAFTLTKNGSPKHPLYVKYETELQPYNYCENCGRL